MDERDAIYQRIEEQRSETGVLTKDADPLPLTKADGDTGISEGYASKFWVVDSTADVTAPGAFLKTVAERGPKSANPRIVARYEHEITIGTFRQIEEDTLGLKVQAFISDDGMYGTSLRRHLKDGVPYGMSIGYKPLGFRKATETDPLIFDHAPDHIIDMVGSDPSRVRVLTEVKLPEISFVTFPSVDNALVMNYRSALDLPQRHIDALMRDFKAGRLTDDHLTHLRAFAQQLPAASIPDGETPKPDAPQTADQRRNYMAEARYLLQRAGAPVWE
jgi:HK97 family phage prohead protease